MPLRIWMPSWAAGPLNTAAWPRRILSAVTPGSAAARPGRSERTRRMCFMGFPSKCDRQELRIADEPLDVELAPARARVVFVLRAQPRRALSRRLARAQVRGVAQAERALDEERGGAAKALAEDDEARL